MKEIVEVDLLKSGETYVVSFLSIVNGTCVGLTESLVECRSRELDGLFRVHGMTKDFSSCSSRWSRVLAFFRA